MPYESGPIQTRKGLPPLVEEGKSSWEIGVILRVSENTVNFHLKNAMRKLETNSRTHCLAKAIRPGLI